jgi:iron complex outermembrane receptor protein
MMTSSSYFLLPSPAVRPARIALAAALVAGALPSALAQAGTGLDVTVTAPRSPSLGIGGFADTPLNRLPMQAASIPAETLKDSGSGRLADLSRFDAGVSDAYNSVNYWDILSVRGYALDNKYNVRRDGLPISAETRLPLDNKAAVEVLKGTSGLQAGTSAPGGLLNLIVKRPEGRIRSGTVGVSSRGGVLASVDLSDRFGADGAIGLRVNAAAERIDPPLRDAKGERHLFALATDWRLSSDTLLEAEFETSRFAAPSQPGFSLLGNAVPAPVDPRINLNNQPWSQPVVMRGDTGSLRWTQRLNADWKFTAHGGVQRLKTDDRLAFPFGCSAENNYDRYCSDGTYDLYAFRSDDERRRTTAAQFSLDGRLATGPLEHRLSTGVLLSRFTQRMDDRLDDGTIVGTGNVSGTAIVPTLPALGLVPNTDRTEKSTEFFVRDALKLDARWTAWLGLRHTRLDRSSVRTDGSRATDYSQSFTTPWLALGWQATPRHLVYGSWGEGVESQVAPNRAGYVNAGQPLAALKSRQAEVGVKGTGDLLDWQLSAFRIERPQSAVLPVTCADGTPGCSRQAIDGTARHQGLEAATQWRHGPWSLAASALLLDAQREGSATAAVNGQRPPNVPERLLKLNARYRVTAVPGLTLLGGLQHEGDRTLLPAIGSPTIPSWTRLDIGLVHLQRVGTTTLTWRAGIENLTDKRAWRESPYQYDHAYLYPMAPRTFRASLQVDL